MVAIKVSRKKKFIQKGERLKSLYVLLQGSVRVTYKTDTWDLGPGSVIGMVESGSETYLCDYTAIEDSVLYVYEYTTPEDFSKIFAEDNKYVSVFVMAAMRQTSFLLKRYEEYYKKAQSYYAFLMEMYQEYGRLCEDYGSTSHPFERIEMAKPFVAKQRINGCITDFYIRMANLPLKSVASVWGKDVQLGVGEILNSTGWMLKALNLIEEVREYLLFQKELLISEKEDNLYQRYYELIMKVSAAGMSVAPLQEIITKIMAYARDNQLYNNEWLNKIFEKYENYDFTASATSGSARWDEDSCKEEGSKNYLEQILDYAEYDSEEAEHFRADIEELKNLTDVYSTTDDVRKMRRRLTKCYFEIYTSVFKKTLEGAPFSNVIKMFLNFGFMDVELAGENVTKSLNDMVERLFLCKADNVYTIYEWLMSIYRGENEPSRNEFDLDYPGYLNELKKTGKIRDTEVKQLLHDNWKRVEFEIENMFMSNSKMTYGKLSSYCPILCEYDVINSVENMLVTAEKINEAINYIRSIDYSIFYRKVVFSDPERDINMEMIQKEVLPNVILMPNTGSRAMMWQETAGIKKDTSARFMFPILTVANISEMMIDVAGRYRWEICRKIQGVRWNDITEPSLTSEYNDYIQYYRKNHELSAEAKEKIKNALYKAKNNYREVFVKDYQNWLNYESKGSFRLNKVSRELMFKYCPFSRNIRQELRINPLYKETFNRFDIMNERNIRKVELLYERYQKKGGEITKELQDNRDFYDL